MAPELMHHGIIAKVRCLAGIGLLSRSHCGGPRNSLPDVEPMESPMKRWRFSVVCGAFGLVFLWLAACTTVMVFWLGDSDWTPRLFPMAMLEVVLGVYALTYMALDVADGKFTE